MSLFAMFRIYVACAALWTALAIWEPVGVPDVRFVDVVRPIYALGDSQWRVLAMSPDQIISLFTLFGVWFLVGVEIFHLRRR